MSKIEKGADFLGHTFYRCQTALNIYTLVQILGSAYIVEIKPLFPTSEQKSMYRNSEGMHHEGARFLDEEAAISYLESKLKTERSGEVTFYSKLK